jgi:hypothetical protein
MEPEGLHPDEAQLLVSLSDALGTDGRPTSSASREMQVKRLGRLRAALTSQWHGPHLPGTEHTRAVCPTRLKQAVDFIKLQTTHAKNCAQMNWACVPDADAGSSMLYRGDVVVVVMAVGNSHTLSVCGVVGIQRSKDQLHQQ